jgi:hypothetical protein
MWRLGTRESEDSRTLKIGLSEMSRLINADQKRCRDYVRSLILIMKEFAIEESQGYIAAAGVEGARTYRIFSFNQILNRRRRAGMTHIVRIGGVVFVDPLTGQEVLPGGNLFPDGKLPASSLLRKQDLKKTTTKQSAPPRPTGRSRSQNPRIATRVRCKPTVVSVEPRSVTDCTVTEIVSAFAVNVAPLNRNRNVTNITGLILSSWTAFFTATFVAWMRKAVANRPVPQTVAPELTQEELERMLQMMPDHPQAGEWRKSIEALKGEGNR